MSEQRKQPFLQNKLSEEQESLYNNLVIDLEGMLGELQCAEQDMILCEKRVTLSKEELLLAEESLREAITTWQEKKKLVKGVESAYEWFVREYKEVVVK